jgi:ATP synthase protein I
MSQHSTPPDSPQRRPSADPWQGFGYLVAGVGVYGLLGWLADRWLGTSFLVAVGIVVGAGFGIWLTIVRFTGPPPPPGEGPDT